MERLNEPFESAAPASLSPAALAATSDGRLLFIACATADQVAVFDTRLARVTDHIAVPASPLGLALSKDESRLYVTCAAPLSILCTVDLTQRQVIHRLPLGHTSMAPVLSPDGKKLYVCNRFNDSVSVVDLELKREVQRIRVVREPVSAAVTPDGRYVVVANHLHGGRANDLHAMGGVSIIDATAGSRVKNIPLGLGSSLLQGVAISPDGRFAAVAHLRSSFWNATTGVELGRMNGNALTVLDLQKLRVLGTLLLDQTGRGAAMPWAVAWISDGKTIVVSHAGTHEVSLVDAPIDTDPLNFFSPFLSAYQAYQARLTSPPQHPVRVRQRLPLPGNGPRALAVCGSSLYVANYFSDNLCKIDLQKPEAAAESFALAKAGACSLARKGEMLFNDARLCAQGWQSCASCHDADARTDAFNWDLLNDGIGNPKNTKSLVGAHQTAPAMALGVRANAETAVRAGLHHILFTDQIDEIAPAIGAYLTSLQPVPSPWLVDGQLSDAAKRGERLFLSARTGCSKCHPAPLFTDLALHDVGTTAQIGGLWGMAAQDKPTDHFDTPTLLELWRTAPYLHDGSALTLRDLLTDKNRSDLHGCTSLLTAQEIDDLVEYLMSL